MKTVNLKVFAFKYWLAKKLNASLEKDKQAIKEDAKISFASFCNIQLIECTRKTLDRSQVEKLAKDNGVDMSTLEKVTTYTRIDIDNIPTEVDTKVNEMLATLENSNDNIVKKVASKVATIK